MRLWPGLALLAALAAFAGVSAKVPPPPSSAESAAPKKVFVIRHLQKGGGEDPPLTAEGAANAERLSAMLADEGIVAIFATPTRRAMETAAPLAKRLGISIRSYDPDDPDALVRAASAASGPVLVVGHSNTVPDLVARFGGMRPAPISDGDYGTVFVVDQDGTVAATEVR